MRSLLSLALVAAVATIALAETANPLPPAAVQAGASVILELAKSEMPGAKPDAAVAGATFKEGQTFEIPFTMQAGKCYGAIGVSMGGVQGLDAQFVAQPTVLAQSATTGSSFVIGGRATGCIKSPLGVSSPVKLVLKVSKGEGMVAAQVFVK